MNINTLIRQQVIADLEQGLVDDEGLPLIKAYFSGRGEPVTASDDGEIGYLEVPAIAVYLQNGSATGQLMDGEEWRSSLVIEIMDLASNQLDDDLDVLAEKVLSVVDREYTANGLLELCNRTGFSYSRDYGAPWGSLALTFSIDMETE